MNSAYIMGTSLTKLRRFSHKVCFVINTHFPPSRGKCRSPKTLGWRVAALHAPWAPSPNFLLNITSFKTSNSSEYHTFYLKTASNTESLIQLQLQTNTFHLPKITSTAKKNQQFPQNKEEKYSHHKIYKGKITSIHTPITL